MLLVIAGLMLLQTAWILTVPPFRGIDEFDHVYRAAAVAQGDWRVGSDAEDGRGQLVEVPESIVRAAHDQCDELPSMGPDNCSGASQAGDGRVLAASAAGNYHPAFYWVIGTLALPFEGAGALYAMRIAAALLCLLFMALGAWAIAKIPGRWPLAAYVMAATPVFIYSTTVVAPNGLEMSAGLGTWAALLALANGHDKATESRLLWLAICSATVLGTLRQLGPIFVMLIVATIAVSDWTPLLAVLKRHARTALVGVALVGASVAGQAVWILSGSGPGTGGASEPEGPTTFRVINLLVWQMQAIGAFPYRDQMAFPVVYPVVGTLVILLVIAGVRVSRGRDRAALLIAVCVTLAFPVVFTLATLSTVGDIWQGRYLLAYGVGFVLIAGRNIGGYAATPRVRSVAVVLGGVAYGVAVAGCLIKVRNDELSENVASVRDSSWHAPWPLLLALLTAVAMVTFVAAVSGRGAIESDSARLGSESVT